MRSIINTGTREIFTCNNCLAMKVVIKTLQKDLTYVESETIVEPPAREPEKK